ncbi:hypothetical protein DWY46_17660 [Blautia obeum]|uniref:SHOCT domain-containing protein n=1 Tax=Blautia obeum TaxID=40520 RepID=A0A412ELU3_9FIRM|nr:SHOCT domain-containing protein [Blautia obeum]RGR45035.1 hypothetical protein DWY46_17660 [Blautia obeum]
MKKIRNVLMIVWTALIVLMIVALMSSNDLSSDNIMVVVVLEVFGIAVLYLIFALLLSIKNKVQKPAISNNSVATQPAVVEKPVRVLNLRVISGKEDFELGSKHTRFDLKQWKDGSVTVSDAPTKYELFDYEWNGPEYRTVEKTTTTSHTKGKSKEKTKRRGHLAGAVVGTAIAPGVGTIVGAAVGTGKKTKGKNNSTTTGTATTTSDNIEVDSYASMKMRNIETNQINIIGFRCSSNIDMQLKSFNISKSSDAVENVRNQKTSVELLKDYKELLDSGIITQEEFDQKKSELL